MDDVVVYTSDWIRINIRWADGRLTVFERDLNSYIWTMQGRDGNYRLVDPEFSRDGSTIILRFPTAQTVYRLFADGAGDFGNERLRWDFENDPTFSRYSSSRGYLTHDLAGALSDYMLLTIWIYWGNDETTIFYKQESGAWLMRARNGSFTSVTPSFSSDANFVYMSLPGSSRRYAFSETGFGTFDDEGFSWYYNFSDR